MATAVERFTEEDPSQPLRTAEGRDPTQPSESAGPFLGDYNVDVTGMGQPQTALAVPPLPPMQRFAEPAAPPSVPAPAPYAGPAEVPGEAGPPAEGPPGLVTAGTGLMDDLMKTYNRRMALAAEMRAEQQAAMDEARARLERSQAGYEAEAQGVRDLMARQVAERPAPPKPPTEPAVPQQRIRLFGEGPENQTGTQALQSIVMNLGLLAQMGMGLKSGYARGASAAYAGAIQGWTDGNMVAAQQQWKEYLGNVQKMQREWQRDRQSYDDILRNHGHDFERAKMSLAIEQTKAGYDKSFVELTFKDLDQRWKMFKVQDDALGDLEKNTLTAMNMMLQADIKQQQQLDMAEHRRNQLIEARLTREMRGEQAAEATAVRREGIEQRREAAQGLEAYRRDLLDLKREQAKEKQEKTSVQQRQLDAAAETSRMAVKNIETILNDPEKGPVVNGYLGVVGQARSKLGRNVPGIAAPPQPVIDVEQNLAMLKSNLLNILSGKQIAQHEEQRLNQMLPKMDSKPEVIRRELENVKPYIEYLAKKPIPGAESTPAGGTQSVPTTGRVIQVRGADGRVRPYQLDPGETGPPKGYELVR